MTQSIRPTRFILDAIGENPAKVLEATSPGRCAMCGFAHHEGDPVVPFSPSDSFTDYHNLCAPESDLICGWCAACWRRDFLQTYLRSVVTEEGIFPCASNDHIAFWLTTPPEGPYMIFIGDQQQQHVVWRTPVNVSRDTMVMRYGERLIMIRPQHLIKATEAAKALAEAIGADNKNKSVKSPFVRLSRDFDDLNHGLLSDAALQVVDEKPSLRQHLDVLLTSTPGEIWALTFTLYSRNPYRPEPVRTAH